MQTKLSRTGASHSRHHNGSPIGASPILGSPQLSESGPCPPAIVASPWRARLLALGVLIAVLVFLGCDLGGRADRSAITLMTYNVQNLFDDVDDGTEYRDYDPGESRWNTARYHEKLARIAEVVFAAQETGPTVIALQEVENENALLELANTYLRDGGYSEAVLVPTPGSAINTAVLSRLPVVKVRSHGVSVLSSEFSARDILEVEIDAHGRRLVIFVNHWKSRSGGERETEPVRRRAAAVVAARIRALAVTDPDAEILVTGDLNISVDESQAVGGEYPVSLVPESALADNPGALAFTFDPASAVISSNSVVLYSPWRTAAAPGSYVYRREWETIDHFLLSPGLVGGSDLRMSEFRVIREPFMVNRDGAPRRWIDDSGYSDHFPLLLTLVWD